MKQQFPLMGPGIPSRRRRRRGKSCLRIACSRCPCGHGSSRRLCGCRCSGTTLLRISHVACNGPHRQLHRHSPLRSVFSLFLGHRDASLAHGMVRTLQSTRRRASLPIMRTSPLHSLLSMALAATPRTTPIGVRPSIRRFRIFSDHQGPVSPGPRL